MVLEPARLELAATGLDAPSGLGAHRCASREDRLRPEAQTQAQDPKDAKRQAAGPIRRLAGLAARPAGHRGANDQAGTFVNDMRGSESTLGTVRNVRDALPDECQLDAIGPQVT